MLHFISKIALGKPDEAVHWRLIKYSKGEFEGGVIEAKVKGTLLTIGGSPEYEDLVGGILAEHAPDQLEFRVSGTIRSKKDQSDLLVSIGLDAEMKQKKGKETYEAKLADKTISTKTLRDIYSKLMDDCSILLTVKPTSGGKEWSMSTKKEYPRPPTKGELKAPDTEFCKAVLPVTDEIMKGVLSAVIPDFKNEFQTKFKQMRVANSYRINEIVLPDEKEKLDYSKIRTKAKRKGVLTRKIEVDGKQLNKEVEFCA
jgi:hypothetical protein